MVSNLPRLPRAGRDCRRGKRTWTAVLAGGALLPTPLYAQDAAGTQINNVAVLTYKVDSTDHSVSSNVATLDVAERLDLTLTRVGSDALSPSDGTVTLAALLTNTGNGNEALQVEAVPPADSLRTRQIAIDGDGDGRFDPAHDTPLVDGRTPVIPAGKALRLVAIVEAGAAQPAGIVTLRARAETGSGTPGTVFAGQGDAGSDAIVGPTGAVAQLAVPLGTTAPPPTLTKSQVVLAPDGTARPVSGATVTYTLVAAFPGATASASIADPIPAVTRYLAGSLSLDGASLTDASDADAGAAGSAGIAVALGAVPAAATHTVRFTVTIQ